MALMHIEICLHQPNDKYKDDILCGKSSYYPITSIDNSKDFNEVINIL